MSSDDPATILKAYTDGLDACDPLVVHFRAVLARLERAESEGARLRNALLDAMQAMHTAKVSLHIGGSHVVIMDRLDEAETRANMALAVRGEQ